MAPVPPAACTPSTSGESNHPANQSEGWQVTSGQKRNCSRVVSADNLRSDEMGCGGCVHEQEERPGPATSSSREQSRIYAYRPPGGVCLFSFPPYPPPVPSILSIGGRRKERHFFPSKGLLSSSPWGAPVSSGEASLVSSGCAGKTTTVSTVSTVVHPEPCHPSWCLVTSCRAFATQASSQD